MRDPDKTGTTAAAWNSRIDTAAPRYASHIDAWVLRGPFHPAWSWWMLGAVDLTDRPGVDPPQRKYPEAEFEIMIVSLDPNSYPPDPDTPGGMVFLTPADLVFQFDGVSREVAGEILGLMVDEIVAGKMSPDSDFRAVWERMLATTVEHYKEGRHDPPVA